MRTHRSLLAPAAAALVLAFIWPASAKVLIQIDKSTQQMTVSQDGSTLYTWPVSTGVQRYDTPNGSFTPSRMAKTHFRREWDNAP
ncbi:MAG: L,D-transpeptidase, partial [Rhizobiales bacterium]|nr:L,D-transpeptidase [Hyphomicrobiales bacterium]